MVKILTSERLTQIRQLVESYATVQPDFDDWLQFGVAVNALDESALAAVTAERDEARAIVANVNNSVIGSQGYFTKPDCVEAIDAESVIRSKYDEYRSVGDIPLVVAQADGKRTLKESVEVAIEKAAVFECEAAQARADRLEQQLAETVEAFICALEERPLPNGQYPHLLYCNGPRTVPAGTRHVTCNCKCGTARASQAEAQLATLKDTLRALPLITMVSAKTNDEPQRIYVYIPKAELNALLAAPEAQIDKGLIRSEDNPVNQLASLKDKLKFLKRSRAWLLGARCDVIEADDLDTLLESISVTEETEP